MKILLEIKPEKAAGIDNISGKFLRDSASVCKTAKLKLLFKKNYKSNPKHYRPISLLSIISKIVERVLYDQTQCFFDEKK